MKKPDKRLKAVKESPAARKLRVASGVSFRPAVIDDKRRKLMDKAVKEAMEP